MTNFANLPATAPKGEDPLPFAAMSAAFNRLAIAVEAQTQAMQASSSSGATLVTDGDDGSPTTLNVTAESVTAGPDSPTTVLNVKIPVATPAQAAAAAPTPVPAHAAAAECAPAPAPAPVVAPVNPADHLTSPDELASLLANTESATGSWFLVTQGIEPGIYSSWAEAAPLVLGVKKSVHTKQGSKWEALGEYAKAWERGGVICRM